MRLKDKIALITGASSGIGKGIALKFAEEGAAVIINYNSNASEAEKLKEQIENAGGRASVYKCNVTNYEEVEKMIKFVIDEYGRIDILVNNSGITKDNLIMKMSPEDFDSVVDTNLKGTFYTIKTATKYMMKQRSGKIINMASVVGITGNASQANYAASKAGVIALTKSVAKEYASRNINVNAIAPGYIETKMTDILSDKVKESILGSIPLKRQGKTEDIANLAVFLASDESAYITGQVINVDGGMVM